MKYAFQKINKYKNTNTEIDGIVFDSKKEAKRWSELKLLQRAGEISDLQRQVSITLIPTHKTPSGKTVRGMKYIADFTYTKGGIKIIEDTKGYRTDVFKAKLKIMSYMLGLEVIET